MSNALADELNRLSSLAGMSNYTPVDWTPYYDTQYQAKLDALNASYEAQKQQLQAQLPKIKQAYDAQRGNVYTSARRSALGNNEVLAAQGLSKNVYSSPASGYAEMARTNQDTSMRNMLNYANLQQQSAVNDIDTQITAAGIERDSALAQALYEIEQSKLQSMQSENQFAADYNLQLAAQQEAIRQYQASLAQSESQYASDYALQQAAQEEAIRQYQASLAQTTAQNALSQAYQELSTFGKIVTQTAADALGVRIGTTLKSLQK